MPDSDYSANFQALLTGHLGLPGDPGKATNITPGSDKYHPQNRTPISTNLDIRDALSHAVAGGYKSFSDEDIKANFKYISGLVGQAQASKLFTSVFIFNQRPEMQKKSAEDKLTSYYDIGSADPDVKSMISKVKGLGSVLQGYRESVDEGIRTQRGVDKPSDNKNTKVSDDLSALTDPKLAKQ